MIDAHEARLMMDGKSSSKYMAVILKIETAIKNAAQNGQSAAVVEMDFSECAPHTVQAVIDTLYSKWYTVGYEFRDGCKKPHNFCIEW